LGFNYGDIWYVQSANGGLTWTAPVNLTSTPNLDERYPSISKYNEPGFANIVWQEDTQPGSYIRGEGAVSRTRQVFLKLALPPVSAEGEKEVVGSFSLSQNYPNPFNPSTAISYTIPVGSEIRLAVYDMLGREIGVLAEGYRNAGTYEADFSGAGLSSGVYYYALRAGTFFQVRKMTIMK
jgi:hypothetical protein